MFLSKQFKIVQGRTTMKVNTDGVLLACWCSQFSNSYNNILDIGSGTGVISLICAQQFLSAQIEAIDVEKEAVLTSNLNFKASNWSERMVCHETALQDFVPNYLYDLIISNPPFFEKAYKSDNTQKNIARHTDSLSFDDIIDFQTEFLAKDGKLALILPVFEADIFIEKATAKGIYLEVKTEVSSSKDKEPHRYMMLFSKSKTDSPKVSRLDIYKGFKEYSEAYKLITKDFYLAF